MSTSAILPFRSFVQTTLGSSSYSPSPFREFRSHRTFRFNVRGVSVPFGLISLAVYLYVYPLGPRVVLFTPLFPPRYSSSSLFTRGILRTNPKPDDDDDVYYYIRWSDDVYYWS